MLFGNMGWFHQKSSGVFLFKALLSALLIFAGCVSTPSAKRANEEAVLLGEKPDFEASPAFMKLVKTQPGSSEYEKARVDYLFERLAKSHYNFIRNAETHSPARAVMHLKWKYLRYRKEAQTAELFIKNCATGSRASGQQYFIKFNGGKHFLLGNILLNELQALDDALIHHQELVKTQLEAIQKEKSAIENIQDNAGVTIPDVEPAKQQPQNSAAH